MGAELDPKFRIQSPLRCDGVGSLDCAEDTQSGTRLAIRWLPVDANGEAAVKALEEIPQHPVLPRIRQTGRLGSSAWVAMDFPEGRMLSTMVGLEPIAPEHVTRMGASIAGALATLHAQGMVHGELSADSVLMLGEGRAILWDAPLVLANRLTDRRGEERALALLIKVAPYLSPERARGLPASAPSDVYGLGAVLCMAAGGQLPPGGTTLAVVHQVANRQWTPELPRAMSPAVRAIVKRMIDPDPLARPEARQVAEELQLLSERTPTLPEMRAVQVPPPLPPKTPTPAAGVKRTVSTSGVRVVDPKIAAAQAVAQTSAASEVEPTRARARTASSSGARAVDPKIAAAQEAVASAAESERAAARTASDSGVREVEPTIVSEAAPRAGSSSSIASGPSAPVEVAPVASTALPRAVAAQATPVLEDDFDPEAFVSEVISQKKHWLIGAAGFIGAIAIVTLGLTLLQGGSSTQPKQAAPNAPDEKAAAASPQAAIVEDVSDFVAPLVKSERPNDVRFRPAKKAMAQPIVARPPAPVRPASASRAEPPARAEPSPQPARAQEQDFSFLPSGAPPPHSELKRPTF